MKKNNKIKNICIITYGYPSEKRMINTFVEELVNKFCDKGINCYVISPQSITKSLIRKVKINSKFYYRKSDNGIKIPVYSPIFLTFSNKLKLFNKINLFNFNFVVNRIFKKIKKEVKFDVIYSHFIFPSGIVANKLGKRYNIPVFVAYGESSNYSIDYLGKEETKKLLDCIKGVISVSTENKNRLIKTNVVSNDIINVFPNAINKNNFYKKDKCECRKKLGFNKDDFIVIFVGRYVSIKGIDRLCSALNNINNDNIKGVFIGEGTLKPNYKNTIFEGMIDHNKLIDYLCASDIFVLPTTEEGCCNSIIEALACGLPVISSNESFNDDILDDNSSIRIDTKNIKEIENAIIKLYNDKNLRDKLSDNALKKSKNFDIDERAKNIIEFMGEKMK